MAEDDFKPDVPTGTAITIADKRSADRLARRMAGELPPNECRFVCITCGWDKTLQFDDDEMSALGGDVTNYGGPCGGCDKMTLQPYERAGGDDFRSIHQMASTNRKRDYGEAADVFIDKMKKEVGGMIGDFGVVPGSTLSPDRGDVAGGVKTTRDDLPEADSVDLDDVKPRKG